MARCIRRCTSWSRKAGSKPNGGRARTTGARSTTRSHGPAARNSTKRPRTGTVFPPRSPRLFNSTRRDMGFRRWLSIIPLRLRSLFHRSDVEQDLDDEMLYHIERQTEQYIAKGLRPQEAHDAALRDFGGIDQLKEKSRDTRRVHLIEDLGRDLLYGLRILWRNRGITAIAVLTLALGFGANTAIFTLINTVLLRPLPYETPDRLVRIWARNQKQEHRLTVSPAEFFDLQERSQVFAEIAALYPAGGGTLTGSGEPERMNGARVSARIFPVLGVSPLLGRTFTPAEDRPGAERNIVISYSLW